MPSRAAITATARETIARGSQSFALASLLFDRKTRERAWLLYAWCRRCDDLADGQTLGHGMQAVADAHLRLETMVKRTDAALAGEWVGDPAFDGLRIVAGETQMPGRWPRELIAGFALDAEGWRPESEADLYTYCYHVAGVVGCMMAVVMGVSPEDQVTLDRACDLGMAFQLANIARDVAEDAANGRCYLPTAWLREAGIDPADVMADREKLASVVQKLTDRAAAFEASAMAGTPKLSLRSAWAVISAGHIYGAIGRKVAALGPAAWDKRVSTSVFEKLGFVARAFGEAGTRERLYRGGTPSPWSRPRA